MKTLIILSVTFLLCSCEWLPGGGGTVTPECNYKGTNPNISHQCLNKTFTIKNETSVNLFGIDVDDDGADDLVFKSSTNGFVSVGNPTPSSNYKLEVFPSTNTYIRTDYYTTSALQLQPVSANFEIGFNFTDPWGGVFEQPYENEQLLVLEYTAQANPKLITYNNLLFYVAENNKYNNVTAFIPFYLKKSGERYYGWVRVNAQSSINFFCNISGCVTNQALAKKITFIDAAVSKVPNISVIAGK